MAPPFAAGFMIGEPASVAAAHRDHDDPEVVQVVAFYPPFLGGVEVVVAELSRALAMLGRRVRVLTSDVPRGGHSVEAESVEVRRHRAWVVAHTPVMPGLLWSLLRLPRHVVVHVHVAHAFVGEVVHLVARLRRRPYVVHFHLDIDPSGPAGRLLPLYKRRLMAPTLRRAAAVIALTPGMADELVQRYGVERSRIHVVGNAVADEFLSAGQVRRADELDRPLRLLFAGRLAVQKNVPRLLRALSLVQTPVLLHVAGDGEDRAALVQQAAGLQHAVTFVGHVDDVRLREEMAWADVFVLTSEREGMPLAAMEAMAMGLPVISTDVPGSRELLQGVGLLVEPSDDAVAAGIERLAANPDLRAELSRAARDRMHDRSWRRVAQDVERVYADAGLRG